MAYRPRRRTLLRSSRIGMKIRRGKEADKTMNGIERALMAAVSPENGCMIHRQHGHGIYFCVVSEWIPPPGAKNQAIGLWTCLN